MRRYLEFAVVILIISALALMLYGALVQAKGDMEEAVVQAELASLRAQLLEKMAHREVFGGALPMSRNPVRWVENKPANYLGEFDHVPEQQGVWYYDLTNDALIYRFYDGRVAGFRLSPGTASESARQGISGVVLLRMSDEFIQGLRK